MTPREATIPSMEQIQMALVAIALVLSAVFLPMVFFGGSTGVIYRQFSATIVSAMALSVVLALTLSPALAANVLQAQARDGRADAGSAGARRASPIGIERGRVKFNDGFAASASTGTSDSVSRRGRAQMAVPRHLRRRLLLLVLLFCAASDRLHARPRIRAMRWSSSAFPRARR